MTDLIDVKPKVEVLPDPRLKRVPPRSIKRAADRLAKKLAKGRTPATAEYFFGVNRQTKRTLAKFAMTKFQRRSRRKPSFTKPRKAKGRYKVK